MIYTKAYPTVSSKVCPGARQISGINPTQQRLSYLLFGIIYADALFIEIFLEGFEFAAVEDAAMPPGAQEACAVAGELHKGGSYTEHAYVEAFVLHGRVDEDHQGIKG